MVNTAEFQRIVDEDLMKLKFILKAKVASFEEIKKEEEKIIETVKNLMTQVKEVEEVLNKEVDVYRAFAGGWSKAYKDKRWSAVGDSIKGELRDFEEEYIKTQDLYTGCVNLHKRLEKLVELIKKIHKSNKDSRGQELQVLEDFRQQKQDLKEGRL